MQGADGLRRRLLDRISHSQDRGQTAINGCVKRGLSLIGQPRRNLGKGRYVQTQFAHEAVSADLDLFSSCLRLDAKTGQRREPRHIGQCKALFRSRRNNGARNRVFGLRLHGGNSCQHGRAVKSRGEV